MVFIFFQLLKDKANLKDMFFLLFTDPNFSGWVSSLGRKLLFKVFVPGKNTIFKKNGKKYK